MRTGSQRLAYSAGLDGLRGLSVTAVLLFHGGFSWASGGFVGVSVFFVLSGFLITSLLLDEHASEGRIDLAAFWIRRFRRLMPAALLCLGGATLFAYTQADPGTLGRLRADVLSALLYVANWRFLLSGLSYEVLFAAPSPVQHFWSLAIEEQFYFVYPPLVALLLMAGGGSRRLLVGVVAALAIASATAMAVLYLPEHPIARVYYGTDTRAAEILIGALLALGRRNGRPGRESGSWAIQAGGVLCLAALATLVVVCDPGSNWLFQGGLVLSSLATAVVIIACLDEGPLSRLLGSPPLRELGRISYGVYLYHWPIFIWFSEKSMDLDPVLLFGLQTSVVLAVSILSYYTIERPIRHGQSLAGWMAPMAALTAGGTVVLGLVYVTHDPPPPWFQDPKFGRVRAMPEPPVDGAPRIAVLGDSVAYTVGTGLELWGAGHKEIQVWNIATFGCGIARRGTIEVASIETNSSACDSWADWWPNELGPYRHDLAVVLTGGFDLVDRRLPEWSAYRGPGDPLFDAYLVAEYTEAVDVLSRDGARVVWLTMPCLDQNRGAARMRGGKLGGKPLGYLEQYSAERIDHLNREILPRVEALRPTAMQIIDLDAHVCPNGVALRKFGQSAPLREDGLHFSRPGSAWLAKWLGPQLEEVIEAAR